MCVFTFVYGEWINEDFEAQEVWSPNFVGNTYQEVMDYVSSNDMKRIFTLKGIRDLRSPKRRCCFPESDMVIGAHHVVVLLYCSETSGK